MADPVEFLFDFASPYSYLASEKIDDLAAKFGRKVKWRPILLGPIFKATGAGLLVDVPLKGAYSQRDFARSARYMGVPFKFPSKFPAPTQHAARAYYWLHGQDCAKARSFAHAVFRAFFVQDRFIAELDVVLEIGREQGLDVAALGEGLARQDIKDRLREETEGAIARGVCGAPFFFVDGEPFWGADRLAQLEKWLETGGF